MRRLRRRTRKGVEVWVDRWAEGWISGGVYMFSSLMKQNKKDKICFVICFAGFFFLNFLCYEVFAKQKKTELPRLYYWSAAILAHAGGALYGTELGSVTLKRIGFFCFPIKHWHSTHTQAHTLSVDCLFLRSPSRVRVTRPGDSELEPQAHCF
jgi:hypothetical protein